MNVILSIPRQLVKRGYLLTALFLMMLGIGKIHFSKAQLISGDGIYYYAQVRSLIKDLDWNFSNDLKMYQPDHAPRKIHTHPETGRVINKYPVGSSLLWLPFLLMAHIISFSLHIMGITMDVSGYGLLDQVLLLIGSIFYFLFSAHLLSLTARMIFPDWKIPRFLGLAFLMLTTALYYTAVEPSMSHIPSLFSVSVFLYLSILSIREKPNLWIALLYGASAALMILVRNQNVFFLILPLFCLLNKDHYRWKHFFLSVLGGIIVLTPQFVYWKVIYNEWILYSYQGESFAYLAQPKFIEVLFSPVSGLVTWHPVHIFSITGLAAIAFSGRPYMRVFLILLLIQLFLYASWECWWLGDSFGYRGLANALPLLFPGFVWVYHQAQKLDYLKQFYSIWTLLFLWNIYLLALYASGKIAHAGPLKWKDLFGWWTV
ncbi:MAG TPA: hypothetical protein VJ917_02010 [Saprospiraceae bacterium]|nr:hypothetical protein [Saprospiraceae bacterium]